MVLTLANCTLASLWPPVIYNAHLTIDNGVITSISEHLPDRPGEIMQCGGRLLMPGLVCAHTHLYSALARGMPAPTQAPRNFREILESIWWRLDRALNETSIRLSSLAGALDAARCGATTLFEHHASPNCIEGSLDMIADGIDEIGLRAVLCYEVTDRGGRERRDAGLAENERFLKQSRTRIRGMVGAHAAFTLGEESLGRIADLARANGTGVHIHVAEDLWDEEYSLATYGVRTAQRLLQAGVLREQSILAHGVHLDDNEFATIHSAGSWLVHNCRSNMNNAVGHARPLAFGARSALGTDGIDHDMFAESRTAFFRTRESDPNVSAERCTQMLAGGGVLASEHFGLPISALEAGAAADLLLMRYDPPTPLTAENLAWHWMYALTSRHVESVMVDGAWIIRDGQFCNVDEERIRAQARVSAGRLWQKMEAL
ncbi:MAG: amidohydrolase family protein [Chloroflexota bacterium]